jgi:hypothetical protein
VGLPAAAQITWLRAQVFVNRSRRGKSAYTLKLEATTRPLAAIDTRRAEARVYADLQTPAGFRASVARMAQQGRLDPAQQARYHEAIAVAEAVNAEGERRAWLGHLGIKARGKGTLQFPGQLAYFELTTPALADPHCVLLLGPECLHLGPFLALDELRDVPGAARWVGYYDPVGYNAFRKGQGGHD